MAEPLSCRHPPIEPVARFRPFFAIADSEPPHRILRQGMSERPNVDVKQARGVQAEDLCFHLAGERLIVVLLNQLIRNLEPPKRFNLPLRGAIPNRIRPPQDMLGVEGLKELPEEMRTDQWMGGHQLCERRP